MNLIRALSHSRSHWLVMADHVLRVFALCAIGWTLVGSAAWLATSPDPLGLDQALFTAIWVLGMAYALLKLARAP